jgi:Cytochrome c7 and related cytochrome c
MDCMDCHNRPAHSYDLPERGLDKAMSAGRISASLPFAKKQALEILKGNYTSRDQAEQKIPAAFARYYQESYPAIWQQRQTEVTSSGRQVLEVWNRNIFPEMKVGWGAYPINIGHTDFPGCFRCHDGGHNAKDGKSISQDCNACHNLLAMDEAAPKILTDLGVVESKSK